MRASASPTPCRPSQQGRREAAVAGPPRTTEGAATMPPHQQQIEPPVDSCTSSLSKTDAVPIYLPVITVIIINVFYFFLNPLMSFISILQA